MKLHRKTVLADLDPIKNARGAVISTGPVTSGHLRPGSLGPPLGTAGSRSVRATGGGAFTYPIIAAAAVRADRFEYSRVNTQSRRARRQGFGNSVDAAGVHHQAPWVDSCLNSQF
jgi:hypothetical protein